MDPRKGLPPAPQALSLEEASLKACSQDINAALTKYNCQLVFYQVHRNGMPADGGQVQIEKKPVMPLIGPGSETPN